MLSPLFLGRSAYIGIIFLFEKRLYGFSNYHEEKILFSNIYESSKDERQVKQIFKMKIFVENKKFIKFEINFYKRLTNPLELNIQVK